jgi:hypothetical protein
MIEDLVEVLVDVLAMSMIPTHEALEAAMIRLTIEAGLAVAAITMTKMTMATCHGISHEMNCSNGEVI